MKKFSDFKGKSLAQSDLRQLYGGAYFTGKNCDDFVDDCNNSTAADGTMSSDRPLAKQACFDDTTTMLERN
jgi:hypothetical protein